MNFVLKAGHYVLVTDSKLCLTNSEHCISSGQGSKRHLSLTSSKQ